MPSSYSDPDPNRPDLPPHLHRGPGRPRAFSWKIWASAALGLTLLLGLMILLLRPDPHAAHRGHHLANLNQSLLPSAERVPLSLPALTDTQGQPITANLLKGRWHLVFFGYTHCPDVCPTTLATLSRMHSLPGLKAENTPGVVFITVDPERDNPARLREYLQAFKAPFQGLTGDKAQIEAFSRQIGAAAEKAPGSSGPIDHATSLFVSDEQGRLAGVILHPADPERILADLRQLQSLRG